MPFNAQSLINNAVSNIICCLVFGSRFDYKDEKYKTILGYFNEIVLLQGGLSVQVSLCIQNIVPYLICIRLN